MASGLNFLKTVREEDFVEYFIFPSITPSGESREEEVQLKNLLDQAEKIVKKNLNGHLWHKDEFKLVVRTRESAALIEDPNDNEELPGHLYGVTHFGDNIEDEWFIVFLLTQISKGIKDAVIRVADSDGEFMLIEAADYLPDWADPEICQNKVFIYKGLIHIISPQLSTDSIETSLGLVRNVTNSTEASKEIQNSIRNRIHGYPQRVRENLHSTSVYLPIAIATILKHRPNLVSAAISSFCNRDMIDMRACRAMKYFPPETRVTVRVTFTKCLYAMLMHSKFTPDKRVGWNLPPVNSNEYKSHSLGVKIACGFEILASQAKPSCGVENDRGWDLYLRKLQERGYFRELLENSRDYNDLMNKAKDYYITHRDSARIAPKLGQEILDLSKTLEIDETKFPSDLPEDDDDSWLNIDPKELEKMLQERYGQRSFTNIDGESPDDATKLTEKLDSFLGHVSGVEGVEFPEEPARPPRGVKRKGKGRVSFSSDTNTAASNHKVNFDPSAFTSAMQNILDFIIPEDNWESDSDMSAFGEEPEMDLDPIDNEMVKNKMQEYMAEMDAELASTNIGKSFERKPNDSFDDVENFNPVDIDMNALKNVLESYQAQMGESGPASNMLGPMGVHLQPGPSHHKRRNGGHD